MTGSRAAESCQAADDAEQAHLDPNQHLLTLEETDRDSDPN
jgi:hypothetical protein